MVGGDYPSGRPFMFAYLNALCIRREKRECEEPTKKVIPPRTHTYVRYGKDSEGVITVAILAQGVTAGHVELGCTKVPVNRASTSHHLKWTDVGE